MSYQHISVDPAIGPVGAIVSGVGLADELSADIIDEIHQAWLAHRVLFFRDQQLTPEQQAAFARRFGELDVYPFMQSLDSHPNVIPIIKEPDAKANFGGGWHTDTSYLECPPKATLLYAVDVPHEGGDTLFADAAAAYERLPEEDKRQYDVPGIYSPKVVHGKGGAYSSLKAKTGDLGTGYGGSEDFAESEVEHPLFRTHDETGKKSIYCSKPHTHRIKGMTREESLPIIGYLQDQVTREDNVTRFHWEEGSLAMWDNRCLFHLALNDYAGKRRHMHRVIVKGPRPS